MNTKKNISDTTVALTSVGPYIAEGYPAYIVWIRKTAFDQFILHYEEKLRNELHGACNRL